MFKVAERIDKGTLLRVNSASPGTQKLPAYLLVGLKHGHRPHLKYCGLGGGQEMALSGEIHGSDRVGNSVFHLMRDSSQISVLIMQWDNLQMPQKLLKVPDDLMIYADYLDIYNDPRKFLILMNPLYSRPFPMVILLKYRQNGDEKVVVDVGEEDLGIGDDYASV